MSTQLNTKTKQSIESHFQNFISFLKKFSNKRTTTNNQIQSNLYITGKFPREVKQNILLIIKTNFSGHVTIRTDNALPVFIMCVINATSRIVLLLRSNPIRSLAMYKLHFISSRSVYSTRSPNRLMNLYIMFSKSSF